MEEIKMYTITINNHIIKYNPDTFSYTSKPLIKDLKFFGNRVGIPIGLHPESIGDLLVALEKKFPGKKITHDIPEDMIEVLTPLEEGKVR